MSWFKKVSGGNEPEKAERQEQLIDKLLVERIILLGTPIDDTVAQKIIAQLLYLEHDSPDQDISLYLNSPGGSITASMAIYDTIKSVKPDVATVCLGQAGGTAAILLAGGARGKRFIQPSSRVVILEPKIYNNAKQDIRTLHNELERMKELIVKILVDDTKMISRQVHSIIQKDKILSAAEAIELGFADAIVNK